MPSSLRFVIVLLGIAALTAPASIFVLYDKDQNEARINAEAMTGGSVKRGEAAIRRFGCNGCHVTAVAGTGGMVGPPLTGFASRAVIAGKFPNTPPNLVAWIRFPQRMVPGNAMPDMGVGEGDARDMAAYLYTRRPVGG